jgi:hypothetical protein
VNWNFHFLKTVLSHLKLTFIVDDLDVPPECEESDRVNSRDFWTKIEQMHIARGLTTGIYVYPYKSLGPPHNLIGDIVLIQQNPHHSSLI